MRSLYGVCAFWLGCSSPATTPDAGPGSDADTCPGDADGDGICDNVDTCPDLADPSQLDPDGDGIGWACDPVETIEHTTIAPTNGPIFGSVSSKGFVARVPAWDLATNQTEEVIATGNPATFWIASSASTDPADAWTKDHNFENVIVTADHQLLASRRMLNTGDTRAIDPSTKTTEVRGPILSGYIRAGTGEPLLISVGQLLTEPRNGTELHPIEMAPANGEWFGYFGSSNYNATSFATDSSPFVASRIYNTMMGWSLRRFTPGANALTNLTPPVAGVRDVSRLRNERGSPWCVRESTTASLYQATSQGITITPTSLHTCSVISYAFPNTEVLLGWSTDVDGNGGLGQTAVFVRNGVSYDIFVDLPNASAVRVVPQSRDVIALVVSAAQNDDPTQIYVVWPNNTVQLVSDDLSYTDVSIGDDTIHVVGAELGGAATGPLRLRRLKQGGTVQNITFDQQLSNGYGARVVTTAEGAAIVNVVGAITFIAPSTSTSATTYPNFNNIAGGTRRGHTVVMTGVMYGTGTSTGAAWAYDEVAGQPRLTRLSDNTTGFNGALADILGTQQSEYFAFYGPVCRFGRIRPGLNGVPTLESSPCAYEDFSTLDVIGQTPTGETLVTADAFNSIQGNRLSALSETGVRTIANGQLLAPVFDRSTQPPTLVAWVARNNFDDYACVEETPLRCWAVPAQMRVVDTRIEAGVISLLLYAQDGMKQRFTWVRMSGPGTATVPW